MTSEYHVLPIDPPYGTKATENPFDCFADWYKAARESEKTDCSAVNLATATRCGAPSNRMVLLKSFDTGGFVFYTNSKSRKGRNLEDNPQASLCFYWPVRGKQVRIEGSVTKVSDEEADAYFATRPLKARIGAWASHQSEPLEDRNDLLKRIAYYTAKWALGQVERPPHWTGFRLVPDCIEFWGEGAHRIHERKVFYLRDEEWYCGYLNP